MPIGLALLALNFEIIKDSEYRKEKIRRGEREALLQALDAVRGISANPEVNEYIKKVKEKISKK